ncbi:MAG: hypothetical protein NW216_02650 [Hyphomicrobium sp.]|nr:hypothetical protein [Hyphomicrobium sp.]
MSCRPRCAHAIAICRAAVRGAVATLSAASLAATVLSAAMLSADPASAQGLKFDPGAKPAVQTEANDAYGKLRFTLELFVDNKPSNRSVFDALLQGLGGLMKEQGTYLLTLEVLGPADEIIARRALVSVERRSSGWFIFNRVVKENETTEWYGDLITDRLLRPDTNDIRVRVRSYYSKDARLDLSTFNLLADIVAKTRLLGLANTALDATWKPLASTIEGMIGSYQQSDVSSIATLSFTRFNTEPNPGSGLFIREYKIEREDGQRPEKVRVQVRVETGTSRARVATLIEGKVSPLTSHGDVLAATRIADQPIDLLLSTSTNEMVKTFMADLGSTAGYQGADVGERCDRLQDELSKSFTRTDKLLSYWAILSMYRRKLATNTHARDCLPETVKGQMTALGLSLADLPFARDTVVAEGPATPGEPDVRKGPEDGKADDGSGPVIARRSIVEDILGRPGATETFQYFPIEKVVEE